MIPSLDPDYARQALEAKAQARRNASASGAPLLVGALCGALAGAAWAHVDAHDPTPAYRWLLAGLAAGIVVAAYVGGIRRLRNPPPPARCPSCRYDWAIRGGDARPMPQWDTCPGCGAAMSDELLEIAIARGRGLRGLAVSEYIEKLHREHA